MFVADVALDYLMLSILPAQGRAITEQEDQGRHVRLHCLVRDLPLDSADELLDVLENRIAVLRGGDFLVDGLLDVALAVDLDELLGDLLVGVAVGYLDQGLFGGADVEAIATFFYSL